MFCLQFNPPTTENADRDKPQIPDHGNNTVDQKVRMCVLYQPLKSHQSSFDFISFSRPLWYPLFQNKKVCISSVISQALFPNHEETWISAHQNQINDNVLSFS